MEGKTVILSVLIITLVMAQVQVEAKKVCCITTTARAIFDGCRWAGGYEETCCSSSGCKLVDDWMHCPDGWAHGIFQNSVDAVSEYCKLGCAASKCGAMNILQNSEDESEIVNGAMEKCAKACSLFCTNGSTTGVETA